MDLLEKSILLQTGHGRRGLKISQIDEVVLVGGSPNPQGPGTGEAVLRPGAHKGVNPDEVVAWARVQAGVLAER